MSALVDVLIVEPTAEARDWLAGILWAADGFRVVGVSAEAEAAARMVARLDPDIILLGSGLADATGFTRRVMSEHPTPVVALIDPDDGTGGGALLREGAVSAQLRPRGAVATARFCAVIAALAQVSVVRRRSPAARRPSAARSRASNRSPARMVAVAASTGGPAALQRLLASLPADLPVPVLVVQHIVHGFTAGLVDSLGTGSRVPVALAAAGTTTTPGTVYVAPDDHHLTVDRAGRTHLIDDPPVSGFRPSASVLFSSLADAWGSGGLAVVLTGMGTDGLLGLHAVHTAGGRVIAQDEATSAVFGMPGAAVAAGIADVIAPIDEIAPHIARLTT